MLMPLKTFLYFNFTLLFNKQEKLDHITENITLHISINIRSLSSIQESRLMGS